MLPPQTPEQIAAEWPLEHIVYNLNRSLPPPDQPTTFGPAFCGHGAARGCGYCPGCLIAALLLYLEHTEYT